MFQFTGERFHGKRGAPCIAVGIRQFPIFGL
jgi:hypothetical protein